MTLGEALQYSFVQHALIVGVLVALCASLVGVPLVLKRNSLIGEGLSHTAFTGTAIAAVINLTNNLYIVMPLTVLTAVLLLSGRNKKIKGDAVIAMISVGALALGYFLINTFSSKTNIAADVCASLFGSVSILTLSLGDVILSIIMSVLVIVFYFAFYNKIFAVTFDSEFTQAAGVKTKTYEVFIAIVIAVVISLSMMFVGSLLTSALIIFPALSAMRVFKSFRSVVICSGIVAVLCAVLGLLVSILCGTPVGSTIVLADIFMFALFCLFGIVIRRRLRNG